MTPTTVTETIKKIVKKSLFNLKTFSKETKEKEIEFTPVKSMQEFLDRIGGDEKKALKVANSGLFKLAQNEARAEMSADGLVNPKVVSAFVNQFRVMFPVKDDSTEERKAQTQKVYELIRSKPALQESLSIIASAHVEDEDEDDSNDSEE